MLSRKRRMMNRRSKGPKKGKIETKLIRLRPSWKRMRKKTNMVSQTRTKKMMNLKTSRKKSTLSKILTNQNQNLKE
jgi:hypothetical protein